jgi:hypothetical protein
MIPVCAKVLTLSLRSKLLAEKMSKHEKENMKLNFLVFIGRWTLDALYPYGLKVKSILL